jgi:hypothetical protein
MSITHPNMPLTEVLPVTTAGAAEASDVHTAPGLHGGRVRAPDSGDTRSNGQAPL